ncbi:hypothetical protein Pan161_35340 [Gimesia algae]|uniref:Uncharacterized protein n=1 Tax=Gimesia algae TaxID=2527971 RepID=A0A517VFT5_9PLAN|nr:hypothetical protein Pan161_35340 [Gimesia algae]
MNQPVSIKVPHQVHSAYSLRSILVIGGLCLAIDGEVEYLMVTKVKPSTIEFGLKPSLHCSHV